jgi:glycolate oxidase iron-sulfur subunit
MQTRFTNEQLAIPRNAVVNQAVRTCVHCGFCTATCPTYVLLGDELDSPRGRIYLIKEMLEKGEAATAETVKHVDRCLSCLSCMTTCPSGVHYMHLVDEARAHIEETYTRPLADRLMRNLLAYVMPRPKLFRLALIGARIVAPLARGLQGFGFKRVAAMLALTPKLTPPERVGAPGTYAAVGVKRGRVALLMGCVQSVIDPGINVAAISLLTRLGYEVVVAGEEACCGSLTHHMGKEHDAINRARRSVDQWTKAAVDAVVITASGCGTTIKDYGHMLRLDAQYTDKAKAISAKAKDISEFLGEADIAAGAQEKGIRVAYHSACSMQHGQKLKTQPQALLRKAGFDVVEIAEGHLCCGSAGTYNILQPEISDRLLTRKAVNIAKTEPQIVATGNIGCMTQIGRAVDVPVVHTIELLNWACGGSKPAKLKDLFT